MNYAKLAKEADLTEEEIEACLGRIKGMMTKEDEVLIEKVLRSNKKIIDLIKTLRNISKEIFYRTFILKAKMPEIIELTSEEIESLFLRIDENPVMPDFDKTIIKNCIKYSFWILDKLEHSKIVLNKFRKLLFGSKTEKQKRKADKDLAKNDAEKALFADSGISGEDEENKENKLEITDQIPIPEIPETIKEKAKIKGHGRMRADAYKDARAEIISHENLKVKDACPMLLCTGRLYDIDPGVMIRIKGQPPAKIVRYETQKLRCNLCGVIFKAGLPNEIGDEKYDEHFKAHLAVQKYFVAVPFYRQEQYLKMLNFPLPDATHFDVVESVADSVYPVIGVLESLAANGKLIHNDDTRVKILEVMKDNQNNPDKKRTGMFTTCIYAETGENIIALYYSGTKHSGENMAAILEKRNKDLPAILQMSDALSANAVGEFKRILINCLTHGRRKFTDIEDFFPEECGFVIEKIALVYKHDKEAKEQYISDMQRQLHHEKHSMPVMQELKIWMQRQIDEHLTEPNSGLGKAIAYMQNHWEKLTRFLSVPGAPLDNNVVERALKLSIRCRKNSLFYKTLHGAAVGNILTSLIATCRLAEQNPVEYLTVLQQNKSHVFKNPKDWLPWNYKSTIEAMHPLVELKAA